MNTEQIARDTVAGNYINLATLLDAENDDNPAAWEMARQLAAESYHAIDTACLQMYARRGTEPPPLPASTRIYLDGRPKVNHREPMSTREFLEKCPGFRESVAPEQILDPATEAAFDELEAQAIQNAHPTPGGLHSIFETITTPMRKPA